MSEFEAWWVWILVAVLGWVSTKWLRRFVNQYLPRPERARLWLRNLLADRTPPLEDRFRVVLCWLEHDPSGDDKRTVEEAFKNISGVTLLRSPRIVAKLAARSEWLAAMREQARSVLEESDADLAVVGVVKQPGRALNLWIVPRSGEGTLSRGDQPYVFEHATLGPDFHEDFSAELSAVALVTVAPLAETKTRGGVLEKG